MNTQKKRFEVPHVYVILLALIVICSALSYVVPAGQYDTAMIDGRDMIGAAFVVLAHVIGLGPF